MELETNIVEFAQQIEAFGELVESRQKLLIQGTTFEAHAFIFDKTPVKTGNARRNWHFEVASGFLGRVWNNLSYIRRLEHGWSKQPGRGFMVQSALLHAEELVRRAAAKLGIELR